MRLFRRLALALLLLLHLSARADWPQYRGPLSDGTSTEKMLARWPVEGPPVLWKLAVQDAFGSFAIQGNRAYFLSTTNDSEACFALNLRIGQPVWATTLDRTIRQSSGGTGPRSTPVADGDRIFTFGTYLKLACLNAADGVVLWQHDLAREFNGQLLTHGIDAYGSGSSPVLEGSLVIVAGGGSNQTFLAFDKTTGRPVWQKESQLITHATPTPATIAGVRQVIFLTKTGLISLAPATGETLWRFPFPSQRPVAASPVVSGDIVYCSAGYGVGALACRISRTNQTFSARELWRTRGANMNHFSTPVARDGFLYGLYGSMMTDTAPLGCVDLATGQLKWSQPGFGEGELILVNGLLIVQGSRGELTLVNPRPEGYQEVSRTHVIGGRAWGFPAFANGVLLHRSDKEIAALDLAPP